MPHCWEQQVRVGLDRALDGTISPGLLEVGGGQDLCDSSTELGEERRPMAQSLLRSVPPQRADPRYRELLGFDLRRKQVLGSNVVKRIPAVAVDSSKELGVLPRSERDDRGQHVSTDLIGHRNSQNILRLEICLRDREAEHVARVRWRIWRRWREQLADVEVRESGELYARGLEGVEDQWVQVELLTALPGFPERGGDDSRLPIERSLGIVQRFTGQATHYLTRVRILKFVCELALPSRLVPGQTTQVWQAERVLTGLEEVLDWVPCSEADIGRLSRA